MNEPRALRLDSRQAQEILLELLNRRIGYLPNWAPPQDTGDMALLEIISRYAETLIQRLNQAPAKNKLAFLDMLGIDLIPAQAARVPIVFQMTEGAPSTRAAAGTRVVAPPAPESTEQIAFETEEGVGLMSGSLKEVISLWPGRDQYINHSAGVVGAEPFRPFSRRQLTNTPHYLYIAHEMLLALDGSATVQVQFDLTQGSSEHLKAAWEYWDGEIWRSFANIDPDCSADDAKLVDSTNGFQDSGRFQLQTEYAETKKAVVNGIESFWIRARLLEPLPTDPAQILPMVDGLQLSTIITQPLEANLSEEFRATLSNQPQLPMLLTMALSLLPNAAKPAKEVQPLGLLPDNAFANVEQLDTTQTFFPFGQNPQPGSVFYFSAVELFTKPGATVSIYVSIADTSSDLLKINESDSKEKGGSQSIIPLEPTLQWEYWNGRHWQTLSITTQFTDKNKETPAYFNATGLFSFTVPTDMRPVEVNGEEALWMRARLERGGYGFVNEVKVNSNSFRYLVNIPPAIAEFRLGYTWQYGPFHPQTVLTYNDFQYEDVTNVAVWPGQQFAPFRLVQDTTPGFYLGFDKPLPVDRFNLFLNIVEDRNEPVGPALLWEYWDGFNWQLLPVADSTNRLRLQGMVSLIGPNDGQPLNRFSSNSLYWLRARLAEDAPPGAPLINAIYPNAVWAAQRQTLLNEPLGRSNGRPNQIFTFRQLPILPGEQIEVRELTGTRANVEWRLLAADILGDDAATIRRLETQLCQEGSQTEIVVGKLRLERDSRKKVTAVWVNWDARDHFYASERHERHYVLARSSGQLHFGNGTQGKVPPTGAEIIARQYRSGGGTKGNVKANSITQLLAGIGGVEAIFNPIPGEGGAEAETPAQAARRGPYTLHHRGRVLTPKDYETMAYEASPAVAVARTLPTSDAGGRLRSGWVTLIIIPHSQEKRPHPSYGLREEVRRYIANRAPADLAGLVVIGPDYQAVGIDVVVVPVNAADAGPVEQRTRTALETFLHPLHGGPKGDGWPPGRTVYLSDVASVLERVEGTDVVTEITLLNENVPQGEWLRIGSNRIAVAGDFRIRVTELAREGMRR